MYDARLTDEKSKLKRKINLKDEDGEGYVINEYVYIIDIGTLAEPLKTREGNYYYLTEDGKKVNKVNEDHFIVVQGNIQLKK